MKNNLLLGLALLPIIVFMASCGKIQDPEFRKLDNFGVKKMGLGSATVGFDAVFNNPNNFGVSVKEAAFDIYLDTTYLGRFTQPNTVDVASKSDFAIPLETTVPFQKAMNMGLERYLGKEVLVKANGSVKVGKAGVYIVKNFNYQGKHVLDVNLLKNPAAAGF
jgi:LEA14-like dessication related protein